MIEIQLSKEDLERVNAFASLRMTDSKKYKKRGGFKRQDLIVGALGELAAYEYLKSEGIDVTPPDFEIYEAADKSFDADLKGNCNGKHYHIKAQSLVSAKRHGVSCLFQRYDPIVSEPCSHDYVIMTVVDVDKLTVDVYAPMSLFDINKNELWGQCNVPHLRSNKVALYLEDLLEKLG